MERHGRRRGNEAGGEGERGLVSRLRALVRVPLFYKLVVANTAFLLLAVLATAFLAPDRSGDGGSDLSGLAGVLAGLVLVSATANGALVALALSPLRSLEDAARRVRRGDLSVRASASPLADRSLAELTGLFNHMLDVLEGSRARRRALTARALEGEERERDRVSRLLLDRTAQSLAGLLLLLRVATTGGEGTPAALGTLRDEVSRTLEDVRRLARELHPPELYEVGLRAAVDARARGIQQATGMPIRVAGRADDRRLSSEGRLGLFRMVEEVLRNAVRHSNATEVRVRLAEEPDWLTVEVSDDGIGFDPTGLEVGGDGKLGLFEVWERAALLGGDARVHSAPGAGTLVRIRLPLPNGAGGQTPVGAR